jgi:O-succinylbenzoic acid--CoA ligase
MSQHLPNSPFLKSESGTYSYSDLTIYTQQIKHIFKNHDLDDHQPVAFLSGTTDELVLSIAACWNLGVPFIPISPNVTKSELNSYLRGLNPPLVFTDQANKNRLSEYPGRQLFFPKFSSSFKSNDKAISRSNDSDSVFGYFFTSGTTGTPKIVPLKRRQLQNAAEGSALNFKPDVGNFWLLCMPLNHIGGISVILRSLIYGSGVYRLPSFDLEKVMDLLRNETRIQAVSLVPTMLQRLLSYSAFEIHNNFKAILLGGAPVPQKLLKEIAEKQIPAIPSFGMTETCAQIASVNLKNLPVLETGLAGSLFQGNDISIRDKVHRPVKNGEMGNIWLKGPQVFDGYYDQKDNRNRFDKEGWFNTNDTGWLDEHNQLFVYSRRSDLIISGGENISPFEIEQALHSLVEIDEAAVTGLPDEEWGEIVAAFIVLKNDYSIDLPGLRKKLGEQLPNFKKPRKLILVESLPKNQSGKIERNQLKSIALKSKL